MRPSLLLLALLFFLGLITGGLYQSWEMAFLRQQESQELVTIAVAGLGLTDLCVSTEARYTRHPAVSDRASIRMDHLGAIEHFPTGSFWNPPHP
jgi:hypothetical protein